MLRNLSITSKLLGRPDPSLAVKRRVRATSMPSPSHVPDVVLSGTPPTVNPPMSGRIVLVIREKAWMLLETSLGNTAPQVEITEAAWSLAGTGNDSHYQLF